MKQMEANRRWRERTGNVAGRKYQMSEKGRAATARSNALEETKSRKALYDLTRVRIS